METPERSMPKEQVKEQTNFQKYLSLIASFKMYGDYKEDTHIPLISKLMDAVDMEEGNEIIILEISCELLGAGFKIKEENLNIVAQTLRQLISFSKYTGKQGMQEFISGFRKLM